METIHIGGYKYITASSVLFLIADANYTRLVLDNGKQLYVATTLKTLQKRFMAFDYFFRPNRGNMVNLRHMSGFTEDSLTLQNNQTFTISRRRKDDFFLKINQ